MVITHETTIAEYEEWLATNPYFSSFKRAVRAVFKMAYAVIRRAKRILSKKRRSCLSPMACRIVMPLDYNRNAVGTYREEAAFEEWRLGIWQARIGVRRHIERHEMFDALADTAQIHRLRQISHVNMELANERLENVNQN